MGWIEHKKLFCNLTKMENELKTALKCLATYTIHGANLVLDVQAQLVKLLILVDAVFFVGTVKWRRWCGVSWWWGTGRCTWWRAHRTRIVEVAVASAVEVFAGFVDVVGVNGLQSSNACLSVILRNKWLNYSSLRNAFNSRFPNFSSPTSHWDVQFGSFEWCADDDSIWKSQTCIAQAAELCSQGRCADDRQCKSRTTSDQQCAPAWSIQSPRGSLSRWEFPSRCTQRACSPTAHSTTGKHLECN